MVITCIFPRLGEHELLVASHVHQAHKQGNRMIIKVAVEPVGAMNSQQDDVLLVRNLIVSGCCPNLSTYPTLCQSSQNAVVSLT
jgi:hypothetical protein